METGHTETIVGKAVAYVKDALGIPPADRPPNVVAKPEYTNAPEPTTEDAMQLDRYTTKSVAEMNIDRARGEDEYIDGAADEHEKAAGQLDRAEGLVHKALDEIHDISHGMRETIIEEKNSRIGMALPSESEMDRAAERARAADSQVKTRQAEQQSRRW